MIGILLVLAGPVVLAVAILPHLLPTFGPEFLTVPLLDRYPTPEDSSSGALFIGALLLPAAGFSTAYLTAGHRLRLWIAGACVALFGLQLVLLSSALLWITGAGLDASALVGADRDESTAILTSPVALLFCLAAAAIMFVLARRTTFDEMSADYFAEGNTVVRVRPLPLWQHAAWALLGLAVWAFVVVLPVFAVARVETLDMLRDDAEAWPITVGGDFAIARAAYAVFLGILIGGVVSSLAKKALYLSPFGRSIQASVDDRTANRWRGLHSVTHYPIALSGATLTAVVLFLVPVGRFGHGGSGPDVVAIAIFAGVSAALLLLGGYLVVNAWKSGDDPLYDSALQQAAPFDVIGTFTTPKRRKRKRK